VSVKDKIILISLIAIVPFGMPFALAYMYKKGYSRKKALDFFKSLIYYDKREK